MDTKEHTTGNGKWLRTKRGTYCMVVDNTHADIGILLVVPLRLRCCVPVLRHLLPKPKPRVAYVQDMARTMPVPRWDAGAAQLLGAG